MPAPAEALGNPWGLRTSEKSRFVFKFKQQSIDQHGIAPAWERREQGCMDKRHPEAKV